MRAVIIANGDIDNYTKAQEYITEDCLVICGDGGIRHSYTMKIMPDYILGDFDSANPQLLEYYKNNNVPLMKFPVRKDATDTELCIEFACEKKPEEIYILGATGSRFDHTLANAHVLMKALEQGIEARIVNGHNIISLCGGAKKTVEIKNHKGKNLSLIPLSSIVYGITSRGLSYPLDNTALKIGSSLGVSNEIISDDVRIDIKEGFLIVVISWD